MKKTYTFTLLGKPIAKKRPRFVKETGHVYDPNASDEGRALWDLTLQARELGLVEPLEGPLHVSFSFTFARPKSHYGSGRNSNKLKDSAPLHADKINKDFDNMAKFYADAMNKVIYDDDKQIVASSITKQYKSYARQKEGTIINVTEL